MNFCDVGIQAALIPCSTETSRSQDGGSRYFKDSLFLWVLVLPSLIRSCSSCPVPPAKNQPYNIRNTHFHLANTEENLQKEIEQYGLQRFDTYTCSYRMRQCRSHIQRGFEGGHEEAFWSLGGHRCWCQRSQGWKRISKHRSRCCAQDQERRGMCPIVRSSSSVCMTY